MTIADKLRILADSAKYDASCASSGAVRQSMPGGLGNSDGTGICHTYTPDGRCVSLLKILLTNYCIYDCQYCVNRISSDVPRARFTPQEVVDLTLEFYRRNFIEGLFLSSGIIQSPDYTTEQLVEVARRLRKDHAFGGYIHLKMIPGARPELVTTAGLYADRVSVNIELPTQADLTRLAPEKTRAAIEGTCRPLLEAELQAIRPTTIVVMGATAARALIGPQAKGMAIRGRVLEGLSWAPRVIVTVHPSAVLRSDEEGAPYFEMLTSDFALAARDMQAPRPEVTHEA